jgi:hypothetical protein
MFGVVLAAISPGPRRGTLTLVKSAWMLRGFVNAVPDRIPIAGV